MPGHLIDKYLEDIQEDKKTSFVKVTKQTKVDRSIGTLATKLAKETDDPWYKKMIGARKKFFKFRTMIKQKYGPRVRTRAITGKGISDLVDKLKKDKK